MPAKLSIGVSKAFRDSYPELVAVFEKVDLPIDRLNKALARMSETRLAPDKAAQAFLRENPDVWKAWLPADVAAKVAASL
ncbi:Substrate binding domain of ABC-type glycine betaine transport system [compost metagenome]